jgi:hypothetical protein
MPNALAMSGHDTPRVAISRITRLSDSRSVG